VTFNPAIATIKAARAASAQRRALERLEATAAKPVAVTPRTGRRTQQAIDALICLRRDVALGLPREALLDRIDDELFKLKR
jgi:hypothetical protein